MRKILAFAAAAAAIGLASSAHATMVDLTFEGIAASYPFSPTKINDFYNGGTSGAGTAFGVGAAVAGWVILTLRFSLRFPDTLIGGRSF